MIFLWQRRPLLVSLITWEGNVSAVGDSFISFNDFFFKPCLWTHRKLSYTCKSRDTWTHPLGSEGLLRVIQGTAFSEGSHCFAVVGRRQLRLLQPGFNSSWLKSFISSLILYSIVTRKHRYLYCQIAVIRVIPRIAECSYITTLLIKHLLHKCFRLHCSEKLNSFQLLVHIF